MSKKSTRCQENEFFIFLSCIIFLCRPYPSDGRLRVRPCGLLRSVLGPSRANALPPLSPSVTAGRRPRLRGWRFEDGPKGPAEPEPQPGEAEVGARSKMIKEAATWAAPTARRQNLRFCRPRSAKPTWKPKGLPTLLRTCRRCGFRRPRFARLEVRKRCLRTETPASARLGRGADMKGPGPFMHPQSTELGFSTACTVKARFPTQR